MADSYMEDTYTFTAVLNENCDLIICDVSPLMIKANIKETCTKGLVKNWNISEIEPYYYQVSNGRKVPSTVKAKKQYMIDTIVCSMAKQGYLFDYSLYEFATGASKCTSRYICP